jgi:hypothetical protein
VSLVAETALGPIIQLPDGDPYAIKMPCGDWERMSQAQFEGKVSVNHAAICRRGCSYHETHDYAAAVDAVGGFRPGAVSDLPPR